MLQIPTIIFNPAFQNQLPELHDGGHLQVLPQTLELLAVDSALLQFAGDDPELQGVQVQLLPQNGFALPKPFLVRHGEMLSEDAELRVFVPHARELHSPHIRAGAQRFAGWTGGDGAQNELAMRRERAWQPREVFHLLT